ncbi:carbohydrate binding domain-containing protein, partial [bacterium]|nr:carbohydrate binding domain-containing protein [bacterium]
MVIPSSKADLLAQYCVQRGLTNEGILEEMFLHFAENAEVTLHVGAERADNPRETRLIKGWDPRNDRDGNGQVDENEAANLVNPNATARKLSDARVPIYFWGPPNDDYIMNVGHPEYQNFIAVMYAPKQLSDGDGLYFDTVPTEFGGSGMYSSRHGSILEYSREERLQGKWLRDMQMLFAKIKIVMPSKFITANGWITADPLVIDGYQAENWIKLASSLNSWKRSIDEAVAHNRRGHICLIQYNPIYHPVYTEFGKKLPVNYDRDKIYGLATYLLAHGDYTYFGFGGHPYGYIEDLWFNAIEYDLGSPQGGYFLFADSSQDNDSNEKVNLLKNGGFEKGDPTNKPADWILPDKSELELDFNVYHSGNSSLRIDRTTTANNINKQYVTLKPNTIYTLLVWLKTENLHSGNGLQVYPHEFEGADGAGVDIQVDGTTDWLEYKQIFKTGADTEGRINIRMSNSVGTAWIDDIHLIEGAVSSQKVYARNYTKGLVLIRPNEGIGF